MVWAWMLWSSHSSNNEGNYGLGSDALTSHSKPSFQVKCNFKNAPRQFATPIVKCEPAWKLRKIHVALMFNHKRSQPRTLAACGIMSIMMLVYGQYTVITIKILWTLFGLCRHYYHDIIVSIWVLPSLSS